MHLKSVFNVVHYVAHTEPVATLSTHDIINGLLMKGMHI